MLIGCFFWGGVDGGLKRFENAFFRLLCMSRIFLEGSVGSTVLLEILLHVELVWGSFGVSSGLERGEGLRLGVLGILDPLPGF